MLNSCDLIIDWRTDMPNSFLIASDATADSIADYIISQKRNARFLITEIKSNRQGWLPKDSWAFIKEYI